MSIKNTLLTASDGATVLLKFDTAGSVKYSVDGVSWHTITGSGGGSDYTFSTGLIEQDGTVTVDPSLVPLLTGGKLDSNTMPNTVATSYANGMSVQSGVLSVANPNVAGSVAVVGLDGKLPVNITDGWIDYRTAESDSSSSTESESLSDGM